MGDRQSGVVHSELDYVTCAGRVVSLTLHVQGQVIPGHTGTFTCLIVTWIVMTAFKTMLDSSFIVCIIQDIALELTCRRSSLGHGQMLMATNTSLK